MKNSETIKPAAIELIPSPARILQAGVDEATLDKLVQQKVAEILTARDQFIFEPFFRSCQVSYELRRLQTVPERKKWSVYYERNGCLHCGKSDRPHSGCGMCANCQGHVRKTLKAIIREMMNEAGQDSQEGRALLRQPTH